MVAVKAIIPHIDLDFTPYGRTAVVLALIYQAVLIPAFSLPASDTALFARRKRVFAIRTLLFIYQDRLTPLTLYQCLSHVVLTLRKILLISPLNYVCTMFCNQIGGYYNTNTQNFRHYPYKSFHLNTPLISLVFPLSFFVLFPFLFLHASFYILFPKFR